VDDEPLNHTVAKGILSGYGMEVFSANSGPEAISFVHDKDVDIIFMDHMMPGMDGVEAMKRIRTELGRGRKDVPIVALTANAVSTAKEMFMREGFDAFLAKPIEVFELERTLRKVLPKSMLTEEEQEAAVLDSDVSDAQKTGVSLSEFGIDEKTGLRYTSNDREFYEQLLIQYANDAAGKIQNADKLLTEKDYKNYEILVHAIKSSSKMIGAMELSEKALALEKAAEALDIDTINAGHAGAMELFRTVAEGIKKCMSGTETPTEEEDFGIMEFDAEEETEEPVKTEDSAGFSGVMEFDPEGGDEQ